MSKKAKRIKQQKKAQNQFKRTDFEVRPVTKADKWCRFRLRLKEEDLKIEAPYGYIVVIPNYYNGMELNVDGIIIKNRLFKGQLYLQIITKRSRNYSTIVKTIPGVKRKNKKRKQSKKVTLRYMNIRNLDKRRS